MAETFGLDDSVDLGLNEPVDLDDLRQNSFYFVQGDLWAVALVSFPDADGILHYMAVLLIEDDCNWFVAQRFDAGWLNDLSNVIAGALAAYSVVILANKARDNG